MTPYLIILSMTTLLAVSSRRSRIKSVKILALGCIILQLILFAGLRNITVGTDTGTYVAKFGRVNSFDDIFQSTEIGYNTLMLIAKLLSDNYISILMLTSIIVVVCYVSTIARLVKRYETGIFLFIAFGFYTFYFNGARQGIAAAICFLAIPFLLERKLKKYLLLVSLACTFHHTALIVAPLYFVAAKAGTKQLLIVMFSSLVLVFFLSTFVQLVALFVNDKYAAYAKVANGGGGVMASFLILQGFLLYFFRTKVKDTNGYYARLLNIYLIGLIPVIASVVSNVNPSGILRLHIYFTSTAILLWPMLFMALSEYKARDFIGFIFIIVVFAFFFMTTSSFSNLVPYSLNLELVNGFK